MNTRHLVDPESVPLLDILPPLHFTPETLPQVRAALSEMNTQGRRVPQPSPIAK